MSEPKFELPEDSFTCIIDSFNPFKDKETGNVHVYWNLVICEGVFASTKLQKVSRLTTPESKTFLRKEVMKLIPDLPDPANLREVAEQLKGMKIRVKRVNRDNNWATYIEGVADNEEDYLF